MASILVVDDELEIGEAIRRVLQRAGFDVEVAGSVAEGLRLTAETQPDVVVTDMILRKTDGVELIRTLRSDYPRVRVIAMSGGGSLGQLSYKPDAIKTHAYLAAAREAGAQEVLTKPFDIADLLAAVRRQLPN